MVRKVYNLNKQTGGQKMIKDLDPLQKRVRTGNV